MTARLGTLQSELPELSVDELGIIWSREGEDLSYGFALEITSGTDISLAGTAKRNQLTQALRALIRSLEEDIYVQIIYDRRPATAAELDLLYKGKNLTHDCQLLAHQRPFLEKAASDECLLRESVIIVFRYPLKQSLYKPWSPFKTKDEKRVSAAIDQLMMRKEAILSQLKAMGIEARLFGRGDIERFMFETMNPTRGGDIGS